MRSELTLVLSDKSNGTYSLTDIPGYESLTTSDFVMTISKWSYSIGLRGGSRGTGGASNIVPTINYNAITGQLTISNCSGSATSTNWTDDHAVGSGSATIYLNIYIK